MEKSNFEVLGGQLRDWRKRRNLSQPDLAQRVGRNRARISELERDLLGGRWGRDRLTLFAEICDALDLVPVLVPRGLATAVLHEVGNTGGGIGPSEAVRSTFDELFVDLGDDEEEAR